MFWGCGLLGVMLCCCSSIPIGTLYFDKQCLKEHWNVVQSQSKALFEKIRTVGRVCICLIVQCMMSVCTAYEPACLMCRVRMGLQCYTGRKMMTHLSF